MRNVKWITVLLAALFLAGCGASPTPQPAEPVQTELPVQPTSVPPVATDAAAPTNPPPPTDAPPAVDINCTETTPHPVGQSIANTYQTTYEEVMTFFCTGVPFEDITLAYQTTEITGVDVKDVMTLWYDYDKNWDDVWTELGIQ